MSVPASRMLAQVLRDGLAADEQPARLVTATTGATGAPAGYINVVIEGVTYKVPKLAHLTAPASGKVAYLLVTPGMMLYIGTI